MLEAMMPLAPHLSLPAIGHMTSTASAGPDAMSTALSKPKLAFSIDSIVGRNSANRVTDGSSPCIERASPRPMYHKHRRSPTCVRSVSPTISHRLNDKSPPNRSAANVSPMSTPSPLSMINGSATGSYMEANRLSHSMVHPSALGPSSASMPHPMMMAAAHHMSTIPQPYHQAVALYPWLLRANPFANRFHGMPFDGGLSSFLLPPFRKPKRIRTAFSPGQLLKLEQAFEKNHYVVGAERKQLASGLGLSETQVKVWFQNRRTKHKRQKQEEDGGSGSNEGNDGQNKSDKSCADSDEDEEEEDIDMEDNEESDNSNEMLINSDIRHQLWYQSMQSRHSSADPLSATNSMPSTSSTATTKI